MPNSQRMFGLAFLLGSGVSIPAGMPATGDITERVLSGREVWRDRDPDGTYNLGSVEHNTDLGHMGRILAFLSLLRVHVDAYYSEGKGRDANYEDLYYVAAQIVDSESGEYDNPAVQPLVDKVRSAMEPFFAVKESEKWVRPSWTLREVAVEATHYIRDVVWRLLQAPPSRLDHLKLITDACRDPSFTSVGVSTLNHDTLLEQWLEMNGFKIGVDVADGFDNPVHDVRYWNSDLVATGRCRIRLLKLHGSVNWFRFRPHNSVGGDAQIGIPLQSNIWSTIAPSGDVGQMPEGNRPWLLVGTFNKMLEYGSGIYADLYFGFRQLLGDATRLVVCGYGFGDKGINRMALEWLWGSDANRMLIIHHNPQGLRENARGILTRNWERLEGMGRLAVFSARVEQAKWPDVRGLLFGASS